MRRVATDLVLGFILILTACSGATQTATPTATSPSALEVAPDTPLVRRALSLVDATIANLPLHQRAVPAKGLVGGHDTEVSTPEGVWMITTPKVPPTTPRHAQIENTGELLLLSQDRDRVLAAYDFVDVPPQWIIVSDTAVYVGRRGDGGAPDSFVARLDRAQTTLIVRYTVPPGLGGTAITPASLARRPGVWRHERRLNLPAHPPSFVGERLVFDKTKYTPRLSLSATSLDVLE